MRRLLHAVVLLPLLALAPGSAESVPQYPVVLDGSWATANGGVPTPWGWVLYADGTYDEGPSPMSPNALACCGAGGWTYVPGAPNQARLWTPSQMYVGAVTAGCVNGDWAYLPYGGVPDGTWNACQVP